MKRDYRCVIFIHNPLPMFPPLLFTVTWRRIAAPWLKRATVLFHEAHTVAIYSRRLSLVAGKKAPVGKGSDAPTPSRGAR